MKAFIRKVAGGQNLNEEEARAAMEEIMTGGASPAQIASFLTALHLKGETASEITGFARVMRAKATKVHSKHSLLVDTCGTGGDGSGSFNISTAAALVAAGAGVPVAKHGNRSMSSSCGSADVLEAMGVKLDIGNEHMGKCLDEVGICFMFAPLLHGAMKYAAGPRREIGIRTVFNILGPLTNPAGAQAQVLGVYSPDLTETMASVLANLGSEHAFVVHGAGGLDEITTAGPAIVFEVKDGLVRRVELDPEKLGFAPAPVRELAGGSVRKNAAILRAVLEGEKGPQRDVVILNAALAMVAGQKAENIVEGIVLAEKSIDSGAALAKLEELARFTAQHVPRQAVSQ